MTTTTVRFDDATFAEIQRRFRAGRPPESAKRKRHSRCDLVASLHSEIEQFLDEGYSFEGLVEYFGSLDVVIPVGTLKNYVGRARRKPGGTRQLPSHNGRRSPGAEADVQRTRTRRAEAHRSHRVPSARSHAAPTAASPSVEVAVDDARPPVATAECTPSEVQPGAPSAPEDAARTDAAASAEIATDDVAAPVDLAKASAGDDESPRRESGADSPVREISSDASPAHAPSTPPKTFADAALVRPPKVSTAVGGTPAIDPDAPSIRETEESTKRAAGQGTASTRRYTPLERTPTNSAASPETASSFPVPRRKRLEDL